MRALGFVLVAGCVTDAEVRQALDRDGDGFLSVAGGGADCDDGDPAVFPGAPERCDDAIDNNCDGAVDDFGEGARTWFEDRDGDGFGTPARTRAACEGWAKGPASGWSRLDTDCNDDAAASFPGGFEACDGLDNDCNDAVDEGAGVATTPGTWHATVGDGLAAALLSGEPVSICAGDHEVLARVPVAGGERLEVRGVGRLTTLRAGGSGLELFTSEGGELVLSGLTLVGPPVSPAVRVSGPGVLEVLDCVIRDSHEGVSIDGPVEARLDRVELVDNRRTGLIASGAFTLEVTEARFAGNARSGMQLIDATGTAIWVARSSFTGHEDRALEAELRGPQLVLDEVSFAGNQDGALRIDGDALLRGVDVVDNLADIGAGITIEGGTTVIDGDCAFRRNVATLRSGAAFVAGGVLVIDGADFGTGPDDNLPQDVQSLDGTVDSALGAMTTATCTPSGCSP